MKKVKFIPAIASFIYLVITNSLPVLAVGGITDPVNIQPEISQDISIGNLVKAVINLLFIVAAVVAIVFLIYGGIRWIISGGDKAAVESARNTIIAAVIGLVIVFLSFFILTVVFQFLGIPSFTNFKIPTVTSPGLGTGGTP